MMLYVVTVSGFALNLHFCFNHLSSIKIDAPASCSKGPQAGKMKCCKDRHLEIKVNDTHQAGSPTFWNKFFTFGFPVLSFADPVFSPQDHFIKNLPDRSPPRSPAVSIFLKNNIFRI
jgi:hypothetical protein